MKRIAIILALTLSCQLAPADDWPEWRGRGRLGVWNETGILEEFPKGGLAVEWRTPIHAGFAGPVATCRTMGREDARNASPDGAGGPAAIPDHSP